jgi:uncharacterized protein YfiM (DUF2279 family)
MYMKLLLKLLLAALIALPVAAVFAISMCFQATPLMPHKTDISVADIERAKRLLDLHDPRTARVGMVRTIVASQEDVELLLNYAVNQFRRGSTHVVLQPGAAIVQASVEVAGSPFGRWVNVDATLRQTDGLPTFDHLTIGSLHVPRFIADYTLSRVVAHFHATDQGRLAQDVVKRVTLSEARMSLAYQWRDDIPDRVRAALVPQADQDRIKVYSDRLVEVVSRVTPGRSISVSQLLPPMFALAKQRGASSDALKENRALIVTLAFYSNGRGLSAIIPAAKMWRKPALRTVTLNARDDFAQHFLISAAIAAEAGSALADAIGLYKEVDDSRGGSGFSFNDIAADRAGTRFGVLAVTEPQKLQAMMAAGAKESDFMPDVSDLPEFMREAEFKRRYGGIGAPAYKKVMADIEARVASRALFR